jgi:hypothetical protein
MLSFKDIKEMDKVIKQRKRPSSQLKVNKENKDTMNFKKCIINLNQPKMGKIISSQKCLKKSKSKEKVPHIRTSSINQKGIFRNASSV